MTKVNWKKHMLPQILRSCSGIRRRFCFRPIAWYFAILRNAYMYLKSLLNFFYLNPTDFNSTIKNIWWQTWSWRLIISVRTLLITVSLVGILIFILLSILLSYRVTAEKLILSVCNPFLYVKWFRVYYICFLSDHIKSKRFHVDISLLS